MRTDFLTIVVLLVAGVMTLALLPSAFGAGAGSDTTLFVLACGTTIGGGVLLGRRNRHALLVLLSLLSLVVLAGCALAASTGIVTSDLIVVICLATITLVVASARLAANQFARPRIPNVLAERFEADRIVEADDVQMVVVCPGPFRADTIAYFDFYLQNCVDLERRVSLALEDRPLFGKGGRIAAPPAETVLGPAEVCKLRVPICTTGQRARSANVGIRLRATGERGRRVRPWRARYATPPLSNLQIALAVLLALPVGVLLVWDRGGLHCRVEFEDNGQRFRVDDLPPTEREGLWRPPPPQ